jgi:catechol 2,3-dioxygenase-like lactoylglutathione lyase family enzyme
VAVVRRVRHDPGMIGRLHGIVIDCPDPSALAAFYQELLGMVRVQDQDDWVAIGDAPDRVGLAFWRAADFTAPTWPDPSVQQQMHFDVMVEDLDAAETSALRLGARPLPGGGETFRVFADPAGHPFCLCQRRMG